MTIAMQSVIIGRSDSGKTIYIHFSMLAFAAAVYQLSSFVYYYTSVFSQAIFALKIQTSALILSLPLFLKFTELYTGYSNRKILPIAAPLVLALVVFNHLTPYSLRFKNLSPSAPIELPWGELLRQYAGDFNSIRLFGVVCLVVFVWCMAQGFRLYWHSKTKKGLLLGFSMLLMLSAGVWGSLIDKQLVHSFYLAGYAFLSLVLLINMQLANEYKKFVATLEKNNHELALAALMFETHDAILIMDTNFKILRANVSFEKLCAYPQQDLIGQHADFLKSQHRDESYYRELWQTLLRKGEWTGNFELIRSNGSTSPTFAKITLLKDTQGQITNIICIFNDLTDIKQTQEYLKHIETIDQLTGLLNRKSFITHLASYLSDSERDTYGALICINLDNFKSINDTYGHDHGDLVLFKTAFRLKSLIGEADLIARFGADEFVIYLRNLGQTEAEAMRTAAEFAELARSAIAKKYHIVADDCFCTASIGVTMLGKDVSDTHELIKRADIAMSGAEKLGGNCVRFFEVDLQQTIESQTRTLNDMHRAITADQFELYYQLQVDNKMQYTGAEALIRWNHPELGLLPPAKFISLAEDSLVIKDIGDWVLNAACRQLGQWAKNTLTSKLSLSVNVSAKQFMDESFIELVKKLVHDYQVNPKLLKLEITENTAISNIQIAIEKMLYLKNDLGIRIAIDDFGVGYSSLSQLKNLPADEIKIDLSFVKNILQSKSDEAVVKTIIDLGKNLEFEIVAEGVETKAQFELLRHYGCDRYQGYLFSKPIPVRELEKRLAA